MPGGEPTLEMRNIHKSFPGVRALSGVDFRLFKGEVHALMGQNGAGKSTLVKVLTGVHRPDSGTILLDDKAIRPDSPLSAQRLGISTVYQEINLCPNLSVAENIFVGKQPMRLGRIDWRTMNRRAEAMLHDLNISVDVTQALASYSIAVQQMVAIARVLEDQSKILVLDEPTSSLDETEVALLFKVIRGLRERGLAILFITHFLDQTYEISDRITVLKNGSFIGEYPSSGIEKLELVAKMLGKELSEFGGAVEGKSLRRREPERAEGGAIEPRGASAAGVAPRAAGKDTAVLRVSGLGARGSIAAFDLEVTAGEVLGFAGLLGSGRTEMARLIFGIDTATEGVVSVRGKRVPPGSPRSAMLAGMGFCSEDRKTEGIFGELTVRENIVLALQGSRGVFKYLPAQRQLEIAERLIHSLRILTPGANNDAGRLSGGNQQKVLLARWLATQPIVLILDEPTRGIDVGAKLEIMELILKLSDEGMSVIFISAEFDEILRCSDTVAVVKDRTKVSELRGSDMTEANILRIIAEGRVQT